MDIDIKIEEVTDSVTRVRMNFSEDSINSRCQSEAKKLAKTISVPGFRRGKTPLKIVETRYGDEIREDVLKRIIEEQCDLILQNMGEPLSSLFYMEDEDFDENKNEYEVTVRIDCIPSIPTPNLAGCKIVYPQVQITDAELDAIIERYKYTFGQWEVVDRPAIESDRLLVDVTALNVEGVVVHSFDSLYYRLDSPGVPDELRVAALGKSAGDVFEVAKLDNFVESELESLDNETEVNVDIQDDKNEQPLEHKQQDDLQNEVKKASIAHSRRIFVKQVERQLDEVTDMFMALLGAKSQEQDDLREAVLRFQRDLLNSEISDCVMMQINTTLLGKYLFTLPKSMIFKQFKKEFDSDLDFRKMIQVSSKIGHINDKFLAYYESKYSEYKISLMLNTLKDQYGFELNQQMLEQAVRVHLSGSLENKLYNPELENEVSEYIQKNRYEAEQLLRTYLTNLTYDILMNGSELERPEMNYTEFLEWSGQPYEFLEEMVLNHHENARKSLFEMRTDPFKTDEDVPDEDTISKPAVLVDEYGIPFTIQQPKNI